MSADTDGMLLPLTALLLRKNVTPADAWSDASASEVGLSWWTGELWQPLVGEDLEMLGAAVPGDVALGLVRRTTSPPVWQRFFRERLHVVDVGGTTNVVNAVLFNAVSGGDDSAIRWVAWTFGRGGQHLRRAACDPRFGMLAALNLLAEPGAQQGVPEQIAGTRRLPRLRQLHYRTTAAYVQHSGNRAARDIPIEGFRVDRSSDLISAVGGSGANPALSATTVLGGKSLRFRTRVGSMSDLCALSNTAFRWSKRLEYKAVFSWIDNVRPVDDEDTVARLRNLLVAQLIADPDLPTADALLPDDLLELDADRSIQYNALPRERAKAQGRTTLTTSMIASMVRASSDAATPDRGLDMELRFFDESFESVGSATALECLTADLSLDDRHFITYDGDFYLVDPSFVQGIDEQLTEIPGASVQLPRFCGETEPEYNKRVARSHSNEYVLLDGTQLRVPGEQGGVEPCDLVSSDGALIHVKRKGKSSVLSHLFLQAANSCALLRRSPDAWTELQEHVVTRARTSTIAESIAAAHASARQHRDGPEIVFAFLGNWKRRSITSLPLFSRISLVTEAARVTGLGYHVTVALVPIDADASASSSNVG